MVGIARVEVEPSVLEVVPGLPAVINIGIFNDSEIVEGYDIRFIGIDDAWLTVEPNPIRLLPGTGGTAIVTIALPHIYPAGEHEIGVMTTAESSQTQVDLQMITIAVAEELQASLTVSPSTVTGGAKARFSVVIKNEGNADVGVGLETTDPDSAITAHFDPQNMTVGAGDTHTSEMLARGKRPWIGSPAPRVITVLGKGRSEPLESTVTFMQKPRIPAWVLSLLAVLLVLLAWLLALFLGLDRVLQDDEPVADEVFSIIGTATEAGSDELLLGVIVTAFELENLTQPKAFGLTAKASPIELRPDGKYNMSAPGTYRIDELPAGLYKLRFDSPEHGSIWFNENGGSATADGASVVTIAKSGHVSPHAPQVEFNRQVSICGTVTFRDTVVEAPPRPSATPQPCKPATSDPSARLAAESRMTEDPVQLETPQPLRVDFDGAIASTRQSQEPQEAQPEEVCARDITYPPESNEPLGGAVVTLVQLDASTDPPVPLEATSASDLVVTKDDGSFSFSGLRSPALYELTVRAIGATTQTMTLDVASGKSARANVTLLPGTQSISGQVSPTDGTTLCTVVTIERPPAVPGVGNPNITTVKLDSDGSFAIPGLEPGSYKITATRQLKGSASPSDPTSRTVTASERVELAADVPADTVDLILGSAPSQVRGSVVDDAGEPVGGVAVTVSNQDTTVTTATEDSKGEYSIADLPTPGSYTITFVKEGFISQIVAIDLPPGVVFDRQITLQPVRTTDLSALFGTVTNTQSSPVAGVTVVGSDGTTKYEAVTSDMPAGQYEFTNLPPGAYTLTFTNQGETTQVLRPLADGERLQVDIVLDVPAPIPLENIKLGPDGIFPFKFGAPAEEVLAALEGPLGAPTNDTGLILSNGSYGTCSNTMVRIVWFGLFMIVITLEDPPPPELSDLNMGGASATPTPEPTATAEPTPTPEPTPTGTPDATQTPEPTPPAETDESTEADEADTEPIQVISAWRLYEDFDPSLSPDHPSRQLTTVDGLRLGSRDPSIGNEPAELVAALLSPDACKADW